MTVLLSRRQFGAGAGALVVGFSLFRHHALAQPTPPAKLPGSLNNNRKLDAWMRIDPEGTVTVFTGKVELGQGAVTALAQIAADELDVGMARVRMIAGDTARTPDEGFTSGSQSMEFGGTALRFAAAEARQILLGLAAEKLGADAQSLTVEDGTVHAPGGKTVAYWTLSPEAALRREATAKAPTKKPEQYKLVGQSVPRLDIPAKVTGGASYVQDMRLPGMVFGRVVRPPNYGAELASVDLDKVKGMPGVLAVVRNGSFLGVVAAREEQAIAARAALAQSAKWQGGTPLPALDKIYDYLKSLPSEDTVISEKTAEAPAAGFNLTLTARYTRPYQAHASIGPSCAVANINDGKLTVWTHTQGVFPLRGDLAQGAWPRCRPHHRHPCAGLRLLRPQRRRRRRLRRRAAGARGAGTAGQGAVDARRRVRLGALWRRHGDERARPARRRRPHRRLDLRALEQHPQHRPGGKGGVNLLAAWYLADPMKSAEPQVIPQPAGGGDRNAIPLYEIPRQRVTHHFIPEMPVRVSALRTLGAYANVFAIESFMDELAKAAGADPVEFRLEHLTDPRAKAVIEAAAKNAGWQKGAEGTGTHGRGIGFARYKNHATYVAVVVRSGGGSRQRHRPRHQGDRRGGRRPDRQSRRAQEPDRGRHHPVHQLDPEGSRAFRPAAHPEPGLADYPILTFPEVPDVDVALIDRPGQPWLGAGEAAHGPTSAAIANAVAHATGARIRDLPLSPDKVKAALG